MKNSEKAVIIAEKLDKMYPPDIEFLEFENSYQLLITVILTAQTTDKQVMKITPALFSKYPEAVMLGNADQKDVEDIIKSTGFFKVKASNIIKTGRMIAEQYSNIVPDNMADLVKLPGVGRKSANVVLGTVYSKPAVIVDTHFKRLVKRFGLTEHDNPDKVEKDIIEIIPPEMQYRFSMTVNNHGRVVCFARKPACMNCMITEYCSYYSKIMGNIQE